MQSSETIRVLVPYLLGGALALLAALGLSWKLLRGRRALKRAHPAAALMRKVRETKASSESGMQIQLCRKSLDRLGPGTEPLLAGLEQRQHSVLVRDCLNRCNDCRLGRLMATADGIPIEAQDGTQLLSDLDELSS